MKTIAFRNSTTFIQRCILLFIIGVFVFCAEYNNPIDPDYKGSYSFNIVNKPFKDSIALFSSCTLTVANTGVDSFAVFSCALNNKVRANGFTVTNRWKIKDTTFLSLYFGDTLTDTLRVTGIKPNNQKNDTLIRVKVYNPFRIVDIKNPSNTGVLRAALDSAMVLRVEKNNSKYDQDSIIWTYNGFIDTLPSGDSIIIKNTQKSPDSVKAVIIDRLKNKFKLFRDLLFNGSAPEISVLGKYNINKIPVDNPEPGDTIKFAVVVSKFDSNFVVVSVAEKGSPLILVSDTVKKVGDTAWLLMKTPIDTDNHYYSIVCHDPTNLPSNEIIYPVTAKVIPPVAKFLKVTDTVPANKKYTLSIDTDKRAVKFKWYFTNDTSKNSVTPKDTTLNFNPSIDLILAEGNYTLHVIPYDRNGFSGSPDSVKLISIPFKYTIETKDSFPDNSIMLGSLYKLSIYTEDNNNNKIDSVKYKWTFIPDTLTKVIDTLSFSADNSSLTFRFKDSIYGAIFSVVGIVNAKDTTKDTINRKWVWAIREYIPICSLLKRLDTTYINTTFKLPLYVENTDPLKDSAAAWPMYRIASGADTNYYHYDSLQFKTTGKKVVYVKAVNKHTNRSSPIDSMTIIVKSDAPHVNIVNDTIPAVVNDPVVITGVEAQRGDKTKSDIETIFWDYKGDSLSDTTSAGSATEITLPAFTKVGPDTIRLWCKDRNGEISPVVTIKVNVKSDTPKVYLVSIAADTQFINKPVSITLKTIDPDNSKLSVKVFANNTEMLPDSLIDTGTARIVKTFSQAGTYEISVKVIDSENHESTLYTVSKKLFIDKGVPSIVSVICSDTGNIFINDSIHFKAVAQDGDSNITMWQYAISDTDKVTTHSTNSLTDSYSTKVRRIITDSLLIDTLFARVVDKENNYSKWNRLPFTIYLGKPVIISATRLKSNVFVTDTELITVSFEDANGRIVSVEYDTTNLFSHLKYETVNVNEKSKQISWPYTVADTGNKTFYIRVRDNDSVLSNLVTVPVNVQKGAPRITEITCTPTLSSIYTLDSVLFTVKVSDPNSNIDSVSVRWNTNGNFIKGRMIQMDQWEFTKVFAATDIGSRSIMFKVVDKTQFSGDSSTVVTVLSSAPVIDSIKTDSTTLWVKDTVNYNVKAHSPNGQLKRVCVNWNGGTTAQDSINTTGRNIDVAFSHSFDTTGGPRPVRFWVLDTKDTLSAKDTIFQISKGAPVISGNSADTIWVVVNNGYNTYNYRPVHTDPNGTVDTFYFGLTSNISQAEKKTTDNASITVEAATIHNANVIRYIWGKDNDGLIRGGMFRVYADSAPPEPLGLYMLVTDNGDSVQIQWDSTALDQKDGTATQVKIMIRFSSSGEPDSVLMNWKNASALRTNGTKRYIKFKKGPVGDVRYRIYLRDSRLTESMSGIAPATIN